MSAIDAERFLDHLPVEMPSGEEITIEGEHITPDHKAIITPDGHMIPNQPEQVIAQEDSTDVLEKRIARFHNRTMESS
jgi:hypothetical protein